MLLSRRGCPCLTPGPSRCLGHPPRHLSKLPTPRPPWPSLAGWPDKCTARRSSLGVGSCPGGRQCKSQATRLLDPSSAQSYFRPHSPPSSLGSSCSPAGLGVSEAAWVGPGSWGRGSGSVVSLATSTGPPSAALLGPCPSRTASNHNTLWGLARRARADAPQIALADSSMTRPHPRAGLPAPSPAPALLLPTGHSPGAIKGAGGWKGRPARS